MGRRFAYVSICMPRPPYCGLPAKEDSCTLNFATLTLGATAELETNESSPSKPAGGYQLGLARSKEHLVRVLLFFLAAAEQP